MDAQRGLSVSGHRNTVLCLHLTSDTYHVTPSGRAPRARGKFWIRRVKLRIFRPDPKSHKSEGFPAAQIFKTHKCQNTYCRSAHFSKAVKFVGAQNPRGTTCSFQREARQQVERGWWRSCGSTWRSALAHVIATHPKRKGSVCVSVATTKQKSLDLDTTSPATCAASTTPSPPAASPRAGRRTWPSCAASTWPTTSGASRDPSSAAYSPSCGSPHTHPPHHTPG